MTDAERYMQFFLDTLNKKKQELSDPNSKPSGEQEGSFYNYLDNQGSVWNGAAAALQGNSDDKSIMDYLSALMGNDSDADRKQALRQDFINFIISLNQRDYDKGLLQDQRAYDYKLLQEQRQYESPEQAINRLKAVGLSRDAALQYLSGSGSGSGASAIGASSPLSSPMSQGSVGNPGGSTFRNYAGAVNDISTSLSNLASVAISGVTVPNMVRSASLMDQQLFDGIYKQNAIKSVGDFMGAIYSLSPDGVPYKRPADGEVRNAESLLKWSQGVSHEDNPALYDFVRSPQFKSFANNPYAWQLYDQLYSDHSNAAQEKTEYDYMTQSELLQLQKHASEIDLESSASALQRLLTENSMFQDLAPYLSTYQIEQVKDDLDMLFAARTPEQLKFRCQQIQDSNAALAYIAMIDRINAKNLWSEVKDSKLLQSLLKSSLVFDRLGFTGFMGNVLRGSAYADTAIKYIGKDLNQQSEQIEQSADIDHLVGKDGRPTGAWHLWHSVKTNADAISDRITKMFYGDRQAWLDFWQSGDKNLNVPELLLPAP